MIPIEQLERLAVALAIGLLIGLERGWQAREEREGERTAGLRTHALAALLGGLWGAIAQALGSMGTTTLAAAFLALSAVIILFRFRETGHDGTFGATTVVAAMLSFTLGAFAMVGDKQVAAASGVAVAGLLALKTVLHDWLKRISWAELRSALLLLAMTFILLPLLPNRGIDPWMSINPFEIWLMTVLIAIISFTGYVAIKLAGERAGILMTGFAGGLVSSTAVTLTLSRLVRDHPTSTSASIAGALIASMTMMFRVLVIVGLVQAPLLIRIGPPIFLAAVTLAVTALPFLWQHGSISRENGGLSLQNPFELSTVLKFGALLTVITALAKLILTNGGTWGAYMLAAASGIADVDAIVLSMARLDSGALDSNVAVRAILIVVAVNTAAKAVLAWIIGGIGIGRVMMLAATAAIIIGLAGHLLWPVR